MSKFTIGLCQRNIRESAAENLDAAAEAVRKAAEGGADIVVLPEMFVCHFVPELMKRCAQPLSGEIAERLSQMAAENGIWLAGGTFPESAYSLDDKAAAMEKKHDISGKEIIYNTCTIFSPDGSLAGIYRKQYLFDVDVPGKVKSCESTVFSPGNETAVIDTGFVSFGVAVCFDIRFPHLFIDMARRGAQLIVVPAAFSVKTGRDHWELLNRARALDAQVYVAGTGVAFQKGAPFECYGHSCVADPWGVILNRAGDGEEIIFAEIDTARVERIRREMPVADRQPYQPEPH